MDRRQGRREAQRTARASGYTKAVRAGGVAVDQEVPRHYGQMPAAVLLAARTAAQVQEQRDVEDAEALDDKIQSYERMEREENAILASAARIRAMTPAVRASWRLIASIKKYAWRQEREVRLERAREARVAEAAAREIARASSTDEWYCRWRDHHDVCSVCECHGGHAPGCGGAAAVGTGSYVQQYDYIDACKYDPTDE